MSEYLIDLGDIEQAQQRIKDAVRRTPCLRARFLREPLLEHAALSLKLECLQVSGSFKARGASNKVGALSEEERRRGLITASGGNHGLGVAYAGHRAGAPVRVYLPHSTPPAKAEALRRWGAEVIFEGDVWDDANRAALDAARRDGLSYVHPFADPAVMAGQGTIGLEILRQSPELDTVVVAIGGGGLISGIATALKESRPAVRVIGVEPVGAPTLKRSLEANRPIELERIETQANTLAPRRTEEGNLRIVRRYVDDIVLVSDEEMREAARWLWREMSLGVELSAAAALAALRTGRVEIARDENVCALVCGAGTDGMT